MPAARFQAPPEACGFSVGGVEYPLDADGCFVCDDAHRPACLRAGCVEVGIAAPTVEEPAPPASDTATTESDAADKARRRK